MANSKQHSVIILITWFGDYPWYFPYFLHSCKFNPSIDFLLFTDTASTHELPVNVKMINISFDDLKKLIDKKLTLKTNIDFAYKLCDFKPAYGLIFEEHTMGYDFWGQSDIDIIFGNLRNFLAKPMLNKKDFISARHDYATGCFTVSRNNQLMNTIFKRSPDHKKVFTAVDYMGFDELNFKHCEIAEGKTLNEIDTSIDCFTHIIKRAEQAKEIETVFDFVLLEGVPGKIKFDHGKLTYHNKYEVALYHLFWLKRIYTPAIRYKKIPDHFSISNTKIYFTK